MARCVRIDGRGTKAPSAPPSSCASCSTRRARSGVKLPPVFNTPYCNTISLAEQPQYPGNLEIEHRLIGAGALERARDGGARELATSRSSAATSRATPRRPICSRSASIISSAPARRAISSTSSRTPRPASTRARFSKAGSARTQLAHYRRETGGKGLTSYCHPYLMPGFWQFPTGSMGLGPITAVYQARFMRYLDNRGLLDTLGAQGLGVRRRRRDGRARGARRAFARRARRARQSDLRRQLQPAAPRRAGARQRLDHPGAGRIVRRRRLERDQGAVGLGLGSAVRARSRRR